MNVLPRHWKLSLATLATWWLVSVPITLELSGYSAYAQRDDSFAYLLGVTLLRFFPFAALIPTLYGLSGRYRMSFGTLGCIFSERSFMARSHASRSRCSS